MLDTRGPGGRSWPVLRDPGPGSVAKHLEASALRGALKQLRPCCCVHTGPGVLQGHSGPQRPRWGWEDPHTALGPRPGSPVLALEGVAVMVASPAEAAWAVSVSPVLL